MDHSQLSPEELAQLHLLFTRLYPGAGQLPPTVQAPSARPPPAIPSPALPPPALPPPALPSPALPPPALPPPSQAQPPILHQYQSQRTLNLGHPSSQTYIQASGSSQPFLGFNTLAPSMVGQVNQQRLASSASQPRQARLPSRTRRRGPAVHPPSLPRAAHIDDCRVNVMDGNSNTEVAGIRVKVKVYPPPEMPSDHLVVYRFLRESFNAKLEAYSLLYLYELSLSTSVATLIERVAQDMEQSSFSYQFTLTPRGTSFSHGEMLPLQLLEIVNRGVPRQTDGQIRLRRAVHATLTISDLIANRMHYAVPTVSIEGNQFVVHLVVRTYPLIAMARLDPTLPPRLHSCISRKVYFHFEVDGVSGIADADEEPSSDEDQTPRPGTIQPRQSERLLPRSQARGNSDPSPPTPPLDSNAEPTTLTILPLQRGHSFSSLYSLPENIWRVPWIRPSGRYMGLFSLRTLTDRVYEAATSGTPPESLNLHGPNVKELVSGFKTLLQNAADNGDFTNILSPDRSFYISEQSGRRNHVRSIGEGIEREVIHTVFEEYRRGETQWFTPHADGLATLTTTHTLATARYVSTARKHSMAVLGAATALCLIHGMSTPPLDPVFIHFLIHDCKLDSIHPEVLGEWHPYLKQTIQDWINLGPDGDPSPFQMHFSTYHDLQVACLHDCDQASHDALAAEMLYRAVIGSEPCSHPELQAFQRGFRLPCRNGFTFYDVAKSWEGGSEAFLRSIWMPQMSSYEAFEDHLIFSGPPDTYQRRLREALADDTITFVSLFVDFLKGRGIPCPQLFEVAKAHFDEVVDLRHIETDGFRFRMFCWATTGSYQREVDASQISVRFVDDNDAGYGNSQLRAAMIPHGKVCFRTCFRSAHIPAAHVIQLATKVYSSATTEPYSFRDGFEHWLLCETLAAIGNHTIA